MSKRREINVYENGNKLKEWNKVEVAKKRRRKERKANEKDKNKRK